MRKHVILLTAAALVAALAFPALAGEGHKCTASTQECLDHMAKASKDKGWIGIEGDMIEQGLEIASVIEGSPADKAGLRPGDVLAGINGVSMAEMTPEVKAAMKPGKTVTCAIDRGGKSLTMDITLAAIPDNVLAQWVGKHMLEEHAVVELAAK